MEQALEDLRSEVERNSNVVQSATALISRLASLIGDAADDPDQVRALADQLSSTSDALAAAVAANTPAQPD